MPVSGWTAGRVIGPSLSATGTRTSTPCWAGSGCAAPTTTARPVNGGLCPATTISAWAGVAVDRVCAGWWPGSLPWRRSPARADLLADLAGVRLSTKRVERAAEADGQAAAAELERQSEALLGAGVRRAGADAVAGHALHHRRRHRRAGRARRRARPGRQERGRPGPHPRGQTRLPVHPDQTRRRRPPGARPGHRHLRAHLRPGRAVHHLSCRPRPAAAAPNTSANSSCSATAPCGSGTWPPRSCPRPPRSSTSTTPANTSTTSPSTWPPCSATNQPDWLAARLDDLDNGDIEDLRQGHHCTTNPPTPTGAPSTPPWTTSSRTPNACATRSSATWACSSAPASSRPAARPLVGQRLKLSGMRWNIPGATGILTLRCHRDSNRWDEIWPQPNNQISPSSAGTSSQSTSQPRPDRPRRP